MTKMSYGEQLKHPNWQRKRLEVLERAEFRCEACADGESTLNVHHKQYLKGRLAWEYEANQLAALCQSCHESEHESDEDFKSVLAALDIDGPRSINDVRALVAGWTRGYGDVPEAFNLAKMAIVASVAGMIARDLCESIGWTKGGPEMMMTIARAMVERPGFAAAMAEAAWAVLQRDEQASQDA